MFFEKNAISVGRKFAKMLKIFDKIDGKIEEYVKIQMIIQDHVKRMQFTISNLGEADVFIWYEWLKKHNPNVDWRASSVLFTQCPDECNYITTFSDIDTDPEEHAQHIHLVLPQL